MLRVLLLIIGLLTAVQLHAQTNTLRGKVIDSKTNKPLAFVSIAVNKGPTGSTSDIDGKFSLQSKDNIVSLKLNYVGYEPQTYVIGNTTNDIIIKMTNKNTEIDEVVVYPDENPAHRIINKVIENRKINDPEKQRSFSYNTYNKFLCTLADTSNSSLMIADTIDYVKLDTPALTTDSTFKNQNFITDTVVAKQFAHLPERKIIRQLADSLLSDSATLQSLKIGMVFLHDNPHLFKQFIHDIDTTLDSDRLYNGFSNYYSQQFSDSLTKEQIFAGLDTLISSKNGQLLLNKVLNDSVVGLITMFKENIVKDTSTIVNVDTTATVEIENMYLDFNKQHIFLMESVTEKKFLYPDNHSEKLLAHSISGLKNPLYVMLATQLQPFSFYKDYIKIGNQNYINPISKGSTRKYFFHIEDTLYSNADTVFIISFQPKKNTNFEALTGILYINTNTYAVQNVIAKSYRNSVFQIKIQQKYSFIDNKQWFPEQLNTEITLKKNESVSINANQPIPIGSGKTYIKNIVLNPELKRRNFNHIETDITGSVSDKNNEFWEEYRTTPLDAKDLYTYEFMDSVSKEENFEKYLQLYFILKSGHIPIRKINVEVKDIVRGNEYEGIRFGLSAHTNKKFSQWIKIGGYIAYGTRDQSFKYGGNTKFFIHKNSEFTARLSYLKDVNEFGVKEIYEDNSLFSDAYWRSFLYKNMANIEQYGASAEIRALNYLKLKGNLSKNNYHIDNKYVIEYQISNNSYNFTELTLGFQYAYKEKVINTFQRELVQQFFSKPTVSKYPVIWFEFTSGNKLLGGEHTYNRFDIKIEKSFKTKYLGITSIKLESGYIDSDVPFVRLYNARASYRPFTINAPNSFATMRIDEFFSDQYASLFLNHNFGKLIIRTERFTPEFNISTGIAFGRLSNYLGDRTAFKTLEKGYFESGMQIAKLVNLKLLKLGVGVYYRYGEYAYNSEFNNFSFRFSLHTPF